MRFRRIFKRYLHYNLPHLLSAFAAIAIFAFLSAAESTLPKPSKSAKKALKQAERLLKMPDKASEAVKYINEALEDSVLASDPKTYYIAGKIQAAIYNEDMKRLSINRNDPKVDRVKMADALLSARNYYLNVMKLDTVVDSKGKVRTQYSGHIVDWLNSQMPQFYNSGIAYLNKKLYFPQAYNAFMVYAESPKLVSDNNSVVAITDSARAKAYFYAGVMAFNAKEYKISADAFELARLYKYPRKEVLVNEMVCYRRLADADSTFQQQAMEKITRIGGEGVAKFGVDPPLFIQKYIAGGINAGDFRQSIATIDSLVKIYPESSSLLLSLRAETLVAMGDTVAALEDYEKASADSTAGFQTLLVTSKMFARKGISELLKVARTGKNAAKKRKQIKETWLVPARKYAERAKSSARKREGIFGDLTDEAVEELDHDLDNTITTIDYYMLQ